MILSVQPNLFNVLNFIVLDVVSCAVVFHLTASIAGRLNERSLRGRARSEVGVPLVPCRLPILGVGLYSTSRHNVNVLAALRFVLLSLFFATEFLSRGVSRNVAVRHDAMEYTYGRAQALGQFDYLPLILRRRSCLGRHNNLLYYGEIRSLNSKLSCMIDRQYMRPNLVQFAMVPSNISLTLRRKDCSYTFNNAMHVQRCPHSTVKCMGLHGEPYFGTCGGVVRLDRKVFICMGANLFMPNQTITTYLARGLCRETHGLKTDDEFWMEIFGNSVAHIQEAFDVLYVSGNRTSKVFFLKNETQEVTEVNAAYFAVVGFVLANIMGLALIDTALLLRGYQRCANDENGIGTILASLSTNTATKKAPETFDIRFWFNREIAMVAQNRNSYFASRVGP